MNNNLPHQNKSGSCLAKSIVFIALCGMILFVYAFITAGIDMSKEKDSISEVAAQVVVPEDNKLVDPANNGKIVGVSGLLETQDILRDDDFGISVPGLRLVREVKIYQRMEVSDGYDGKIERDGHGRVVDTSTDLYVINDWVDAPVEFYPFRHAGHLSREEQQKNANEGSELFYKNHSSNSQNVKLGAYAISPAIIASEKWAKIPTRVLNMSKHPWPESIKQHAVLVDNALHMRKAGFTAEERQAYEAQIGDLRLRWRLVANKQEATIIAKQDGSMLTLGETSAQDDYFELHPDIEDVRSYLDGELSLNSSGKIALVVVSFLCYWFFCMLMLWGIRFGSRQIALFEGWMALYKYASAALMSCIATSFFQSIALLSEGKWAATGLLLFSIFLAVYLGKKAAAKGRELVFSGPTRVEYDE